MRTCLYIHTYILSHLSIIGTIIKSPVCSKSICNSKKMGEKLEIQKKSHKKFQKNGGRKIGICRIVRFQPVFLINLLRSKESNIISKF